ncbi:unnamed protein product [Cylicocyclus nassatus]|uniref:Transmembrane protein 65 n=1 Tax=Cylicocyclus nassatus TaxID=53992 RepID=A0AA36M7J7_CYLNA|nr:unnamed protein product [Cylicocyclus nassatus]
MRLLASTGRLLSRVNSTRSCDTTSVVCPIVQRRLSIEMWPVVKRESTTSAFHYYDKIVVEDAYGAQEIATRLSRREQKLLREALDELAARQDSEKPVPMSRGQIRSLFLVNSLPFIGFGFLDNLIMICAGEYIDQQLGAFLCLSTMAAAALGNLISDVAGVGLAHYVEGLVNKVGIKHPVLTSEQLDSSKARWTTHSSRAFGLSIGCIIGMFPLLFFNRDEEKAEKQAARDAAAATAV